MVNMDANSDDFSPFLQENGHSQFYFCVPASGLISDSRCSYMTVGQNAQSLAGKYIISLLK